MDSGVLLAFLLHFQPSRHQNFCATLSRARIHLGASHPCTALQGLVLHRRRAATCHPHSHRHSTLSAMSLAQTLTSTTGLLASTPWTHLLGTPLALGKGCWGWDELSIGLVNTPLKENPEEAVQLAPLGEAGLGEEGDAGRQREAGRITYRMI